MCSEYCTIILMNYLICFISPKWVPLSSLFSEQYLNLKKYLKKNPNWLGLWWWWGGGGGGGGWWWWWWWGWSGTSCVVTVIFQTKPQIRVSNSQSWTHLPAPKMEPNLFQPMADLPSPHRPLSPQMEKPSNLTETWENTNINIYNLI